MDLTAWLDTNRFRYSDFDVGQLHDIVKAKGLRITVIVPAKDVADTIGNVIDKTIKPLVNAGIVSSVVAVVTNRPGDQTGAVAAAHGARIVVRELVASELGPSLGKGDALWRALLVTEGDIVAFLDGDTGDPCPAHLIGIIAPLVLFDHIKMVRGCFARPFRRADGQVTENEGGRVTEICARPLLNMHWPDLAGFSQPLAGEFAARRDTLEKLAIPVGYGVEIATLIDTYELEGLRALAEVDVGSRQNQHKPLRELTSMSYAIMCAVQKRLNRSGTVNDKIYLPWKAECATVNTTERSPLELRKGRGETPPQSPKQTANTYSPFVQIDGVENLRDAGNHALPNGHFVASGLIYRSGALSQMTSCGHEQLQKLGIKAVFDTRSKIELEKAATMHGGSQNMDMWEREYQNWTASDAQRFHVPILNDSDFSDSVNAIRFANYADTNPEGFARAYMQLVEQIGPCMSTILQYLALHPNAPILYHCTAGKDRTGVISMLLLLLAGCDPGTIAAEYALSEVGLCDWRPKTVERLMNGDHPTLRGNRIACENMTSARESSMLATVDAFIHQYGSVENWAVTHAGTSLETLEKVKRTLTAT